jgi:hypothetical protein
MMPMVNLPNKDGRLAPHLRDVPCVDGMAA